MKSISDSETVKISSITMLAEFVCQNDWSQGIFKNNHRSIANFISASIIALDIDNDRDEKCTLEEAKDKYASYQHIIATSRNHQRVKNEGQSNEKPAVDRFRVILFLDRVITDAATYKETWLDLERKFPFIDPAAKDASRFWYACKDIVSTKETGELVPVITPEVDKSKETKQNNPTKLCEIKLIGVDDIQDPNDGVFDKEIIDWTLDILKKNGHGITTEYDNFLKLAMAFRSVDLTYDEVDKIFQLSSGHDYEKNRKIYDKLDPSDITFATAVHFAKQCMPVINEIACGDIIIKVESKHLQLNEAQKKFFELNNIPQDKYKDAVFGNYVTPASTVGFMQRIIVGGLERIGTIDTNFLKHFAGYGIHLSLEFINLYMQNRTEDDHQMCLEVLSNYNESNKENRVIVAEILEALHKIRLRDRLNVELEGDPFLIPKLPLPVSEEFVSKLDKVQNLHQLVTTLSDYNLYFNFDRNTLLSDDIAEHFYQFADEYLKTIVFEKTQGGERPKRDELEKRLVSDIKNEFRLKISGNTFNKTQDWLSKLSQLEQKELKNIISGDMFKDFCYMNNQGWLKLENPVGILTKMKQAPVIDCAGVLLLMQNFILTYNDIEQVDAERRQAEIDEFSEETMRIYKRLIKDLRNFKISKDVSFDIETILNSFEPIINPRLGILF